MSDDEGNAEASTQYWKPAKASASRKGSFLMVKGKACKIVEMSTSKTGKHGHAKVHFIALDIFTGKKLEDLCPSTHNLSVPVVSRKEFLLVDIGDDGFCSLMLESGETKDDLKLPGEELGEKIRAEFDAGKDLMLVVLAAMGEESVVSCRSDKS